MAPQFPHVTRLIQKWCCMSELISLAHSLRICSAVGVLSACNTLPILFQDIIFSIVIGGLANRIKSVRLELQGDCWLGVVDDEVILCKFQGFFFRVRLVCSPIGVSFMAYA